MVPTLALTRASTAPTVPCCPPPVTVKGVQPGQANNVTSTVTSNEALPRSEESTVATETRSPFPALSKEIDETTIELNASNTLRVDLTIVQHGRTMIRGIGFIYLFRV